ncbi:MAG: LytTR family transcriptional regulator [Firmicutes bacterium]|nr:LytTR family transcriptional regulator [Bacillota bacterium]
MLKKTLSIKIRRRIVVLQMGDILFMEKKKRQVVLHASDGEYLFYGRFYELMDDLDARFAWCHRSYILNMDRIVSMGDCVIRLDDDTELVFGKEPYGRLRETYDRYLDWKRSLRKAQRHRRGQ